MRGMKFLRVSRSIVHAGFFPAVALGVVAQFFMPTEAARSDVAAYLSGLNSGGTNVYITASPAGSVQHAEMVFKDPKTSTGIKRAGLAMPDGSRVAMRDEKKGEGGTPDEDRVTRDQKKGRIVSIMPVSPPKYFTAGSILQRTSFLYKPMTETGTQVAFVKPKIAGKELQIAEAFYMNKPPSPDKSVPVEIASIVNNPRADVLATAYGEPEPDYAKTSPFDSILNNDLSAGRFVPKIGPDDHAWAATALPDGVFSDKEQDCLTRGIYFEARGEPIKGQAAVAQVILNRVRNPAYPKTICGVVFQNENWKNRCQFSFACDNIFDRIINRDRWKIARDVAMAVTAGKVWLPEIGSATHYHAVYVHPGWAREMERVARIGDHIFYRTYGGGWS